MKEEKTGQTPVPAAVKRRSSLPLLEAYVTILGTILGLILTWSQVRIAYSEAARAQRAEALGYTLESVHTHYQYEVQLGDTALSIPAPSLQLQVTHGSLHSITAISFDGDTFHEFSNLPIQESWRGCLVDITMPANAILREGDLVYDYFFLFLEPAEGESRLDLICNTISLETQEVQSQVFHPAALVQLEKMPEGALREMFEVYHTLWESLDSLGLLSF